MAERSTGEPPKSYRQGPGIILGIVGHLVFVCADRELVLLVGHHLLQIYLTLLSPLRLA
ncbi:hypothetical protein U1Q18_032053 [Sarracenia purpurea var. burkii]